MGPVKGGAKSSLFPTVPTVTSAMLGTQKGLTKICSHYYKCLGNVRLQELGEERRGQSSSFSILATRQNYMGCFTEISMLGHHPRGSDFFDMIWAQAWVFLEPPQIVYCAAGLRGLG